MARNILVVEDDRNISDLIRMYLDKEGFEVRIAYDGGKAVEEFEKQKPDLVLLDIMLPVLDGWGVCAKIREKAKTPIIMLTAKGDVGDRITGLEMGADDYIVKPFEVLELLARVDVVLRRYNKVDCVLEAGDLTIDTRSMQVRRSGEEIPLTKKEYDLLLLFARNPGTAMYRETIYERVWGGDYTGESRTVDLHIQRLRKKVGWEKKLKAISKVGYRLEL